MLLGVREQLPGIIRGRRAVVRGEFFSSGGRRDTGAYELVPDPESTALGITAAGALGLLARRRPR